MKTLLGVFDSGRLSVLKETYNEGWKRNKQISDGKSYLFEIVKKSQDSDFKKVSKFRKKIVAKRKRKIGV